MSLKVSVFIATSLDGFIAREDGSLDWLDEANKLVPQGEDAGYQAFFDSIDVLVMGRNSYEKVLSFGQWPYADKRVIVLSRKVLKIPDNISETVSHSSESPSELYSRLDSEGGKHLYIDGGNTIQRFLSDCLVDQMIITTVPFVIGSGIPLFRKTEKDVRLQLVSSKAYEFGFVQSCYVVVK
ncbi:dihydrofolate reductase [bacterium]|jgi:dihydrofolate reductase|nr:dihydrofolate reductase [bacterium]